MRSLRSIRTVRSLVDGRKARSRAGALLELSALATEKELLTRELDRWHQRKREIETRLAEIAEKEQRLEVAAKAPPAAAPAPGAVPGELKVKSFEY
jgi:predicted nuclease with TOPRIM domain